MVVAASEIEGQPEWLALVAEQVRRTRFGVVQLVIHEARVVQIERTEKVRVGQSEPESSARHQ